MKGYEILTTDNSRKIDLTQYLGTDNNLRKEINFSTPHMPEDLHYEQSYEFLIPQDGQITARICPNSFKMNDKGDEDLSKFHKVVVKPGEILVIYPEHCHRVLDKGRFVALKFEGKFKILAKPDKNAPGCCPNKDCSLWSYCERLGIENKL